MNIKDVDLLDKDGDGRLSLDEFMQGATTAYTSSDTTPTISRDTTAASQDILLESGEFYSNSVSIVFLQLFLINSLQRVGKNKLVFF